MTCNTGPILWNIKKFRFAYHNKVSFHTTRNSFDKSIDSISKVLNIFKNMQHGNVGFSESHYRLSSEVIPYIMISRFLFLIKEIELICHMTRVAKYAKFLRIKPM